MQVCKCDRCKVIAEPNKKTFWAKAVLPSTIRFGEIDLCENCVFELRRWYKECKNKQS